MNKSTITAIPTFPQTLAQHKRSITRLKTSTLQINMGLLCNQECRHCHLEAGPHRSEIMTAETIQEVVAFAREGAFQAADITGGAPELNTNLPLLIREISPLVQRVSLRSNLTALSDGSHDPLRALLEKYRVAIIASLPSSNPSQADAQRGQGIFLKSIRAMQGLNARGYGQEGSGLELNLVANPTGAYLPSSQEQIEKKFRLDLKNKWGVVFNHLYAFANVPLGRFRLWLSKSGNLESYCQKLAQSFNPAALEGVMCRTMVSVSWDGFLFDCDFNLSQGLFMGGKKTPLSEGKPLLRPGAPIAVSDHCYACTAGAGFT
ncbi:MAG: arsenosugar biosynthesis radical SAM protein ArsS [Deltaproteobacteria bacterium]|nr:arsenosugar biosynthesis radical SAM protein ArsS [Deltaproteobacteria bacterium]